MSWAFGETVTLLTRTVVGRDQDGNDIWQDAETLFGNCPVWPRGASELVQGQDTTITGLSVLLPPGSTVAATDRVVIRGLRYEVDGEPGVYRSPLTGTDPGVQVNLTRVRG